MPSVTVNGASGSVVVNYDSANYAAAAYNLLTEAGAKGYGSGTVPGYLVTPGQNVVVPDGTTIIGIGDDTVISATTPTITNVYDSSTATNQLVFAGDDVTMLFGTSVGGGELLASGNDTISVASGWMVGANGEGAMIFASGTDTLFGSGADTIVADGNDTVFGGVGSTIYGGANGSLLYVGGSGPDTVEPGAGNMTAFGGSQQTFDITIGDATIVAGSGTSTNPDTYTINGGSGLTTYFAADNSSVSFSGNSSGNLFVSSSTTGNRDTINASGASGSNVFYAGAGNDSIVGGKGGGSVIWAGSGNDTLMGGGAGGNIFGFVAGAGGNTVIIGDFNSTDKLLLNPGVSIMSQTIGASDLTVTLSDSTTIIFTGLQSDITPGEIIT